MIGSIDFVHLMILDRSGAWNYVLGDDRHLNPTKKRLSLQKLVYYVLNVETDATVKVLLVEIAYKNT